MRNTLRTMSTDGARVTDSRHVRAAIPSHAVVAAVISSQAAVLAMY